MRYRRVCRLTYKVFSYTERCTGRENLACRNWGATAREISKSTGKLCHKLGELWRDAFELESGKQESVKKRGCRHMWKEQAVVSVGCKGGTCRRWRVEGPEEGCGNEEEKWGHTRKPSGNSKSKHE